MPSFAQAKPHFLDHPEVRRQICRASYVLPWCAVAHLVLTEGRPSLLASLSTFGFVAADTAFCMSVLLHRFFAHRAFHTSKTTQLALAWCSCLAYQMGPLWWVSKHRRHHKHCDTPVDPHSWSETTWWYAWVGWTVAPKEQHVDSEFLGSLAHQPGLMTVERLWFLPPVVLTTALKLGCGMHPAYPLFTMLACRLVTLQFNCEYHPPSHEEDKRTCKSVNMIRFLSEVVGESHHEDHHDHPARAKRPGLDLAYKAFIAPLCFAGLAWLPAA